MQIYDFISYRKQNKQYFHFRFLKIFPFTLFCTFHTDVRPLVANNYLQSEKDSGSWARDIVGALKTGDLEQVRKLLKVGTVFPSETRTINEFKVI